MNCIENSSKHNELKDSSCRKICQLEERVKELNCLYKISNIIEKRVSLEDTYLEILNIIPDAFQYPEITCSRIILEDEVFQTKNFKETPWKIRGSIVAQDKHVGFLEVCYLEERARAYEESFLKEERNLIEGITRHLGNVFKIRETENNLDFAIEKERYLESVINSSPVVAFLWKNGEKWPVEFVSENIEQYGYKAEDFTSGHLIYGDIVHTDDIDELVSDFYRNVREKKSNFTKEYRILTKHSAVRWVEEKTFIEYDQNENISRCHGIISDITKNKNVEKVKLEHLHFLQKMIDSVPAPIFYKSLKGTYLGCNNAFENFIGMNKENIIGRTVYDIAPQDLADTYYQKDRELIECGGVQAYESSVMYSDGTRHDVIFNKATFNNASGNCAGLIGVMLDITARKRAEILSKENEELNQISQMKDLFTDILTHDLLNPAGVIRGYTEVLLDMEEDNKKLEMLEKIDNNIIKLIDLIETTSKLAKLNSVDEIKFEKMNLYLMLERIIEGFRTQFENKNISLHFEANG